MVEMEKSVGIYMDFENFYNGVLELFDLDKRLIKSRKVKGRNLIYFNSIYNVERDFITEAERKILKNTLSYFFKFLSKEFPLGEVRFIKAMGVFQNLPFYENFDNNLNLRQFLSMNFVQPVIPFENAKNKNSADIKLAIEFISDLGVYGRKSIDTVILFSGDSDLFPLYIWAKEHLDLEVIVATFENRLPAVYRNNIGWNLESLDTYLIDAFINSIGDINNVSKVFTFTKVWIYNLLQKFTEYLNKIMETEKKEIEGLDKEIRFNKELYNTISKEFEEEVTFISQLKYKLEDIKASLGFDKSSYNEFLESLKTNLQEHFESNSNFYFYDLSNEKRKDLLACLLIDEEFLKFLEDKDMFINIDYLSIGKNGIDFSGKIQKRKYDNKF